MARVSLIKPVCNAWPEHGANAVKRIKSCLQSTMGNDVLWSLLINGPDLAELIGKTVQRYESAKHNYKKPPKPNTKSHSIQTIPVSVQTEPIPLENRWEDNVGNTHQT